MPVPKKPRNNPGGLARLQWYYQMGMLTEEEYRRLRRRTLSINIYKGKARKDESKGSKTSFGFSR